MLRERFRRPLDRAAARLSESTREDAALLPHDLWGSLAHARMLGQTGIIPAASARRIEAGLRGLAREAARGRFPLDPALEDVHLNVEDALTRRIGPDGERLHTARSRNDQVATDLLTYRPGRLARPRARHARRRRRALDGGPGSRRPQRRRWLDPPPAGPATLLGPDPRHPRAAVRAGRGAVLRPPSTIRSVAPRERRDRGELIADRPAAHRAAPRLRVAHGEFAGRGLGPGRGGRDPLRSRPPRDPRLRARGGAGPRFHARRSNGSISPTSSSRRAR